MAQVRGAAGPGDEEPDQPGDEVPDAPELWGNNGLVGEGRYRLTRRLGQGGMAEVFAAEDVRLGRTVAVKLLRTDLAQDPVSKARFTREAQSVAGLNHHAVVAVFDSGEEQVGRNVVPYIVMELVNGHTIRELLVGSDTPPPPEQALAIVSGVLEALAYSHHHGIVHRDIKPANVIITDTGSVKVMDFGIARALHGANQTMTQTGMVMGTPQYLSPEQALGKAVDTRSDLYAVGCMLYELLAQRPPFVGETPLAVVYQHVQDQPRLPSEVSSAPPELDGLVMRSLAKEPDDRFQTAEEMRGLVQYAARTLDEHGSHTGGLWNTGAITSVTTPPMGTQSLAGARAGGNTPPTGQLTAPLLLGDPRGGDDEPPRRGGGRGKTLLFALLAVVAIGTGVLVAAQRDNGDGDKPDPKQTSETTEEQTEEPEDDDEEEPDDPVHTEDPTGDSGWDNGEEWGDNGSGNGGWEDGDDDLPTDTDEPTTPDEPTESETDPETPPEETSQGNGTEGDGGDDGGDDAGAGGGESGNPAGGTDPGGPGGAAEGSEGDATP
ncbi:protein kinase domain-containing protein [Streptomyces sedi]|uniref:non-specific serine/threonine protein kinase n=1 Tax=Streptomyces sedi TaxID=555059 RepID=A0A5C4V2V7_9ACTN|nr:protein kinase [Streptomyces sedi]TNM30290.1 serine/threonine protein kinase [Streptomyces sedi]